MDKEKTDNIVQEEKPQAELELIGDLLRSTREKKGIELRLVSQKTRINYRILENLENNKMEDLPNKTYVKGFVQTYAKEIGLDISLAQNSLQFSYDHFLNKGAKATNKKSRPERIKKTTKKATTKPNSQLNDSKTTNSLMETSSKNQKKLLIIAAAVVVVIVIAGTLFQNKDNLVPTTEMATANKDNKPSDTVEAKPEKVEAKEVVTTEEKIQPKIATTEMKEVKKEAATPKEEKKIEEPKVVPTPKPKIIKKKTIKRSSKERFPEIQFRKISSSPVMFTVNPDAKENTNNSLISSGIRNSMVSGKQNIFINAVAGDTWISYKKDDAQVRNFILRKGRTLMIRGNEILLFFGNINATKIFYNNHLVIAKSVSGVKSLVFPEENKVNHYIPLFVRDRHGVSYSAQNYMDAREEHLEESSGQ